MCERSLPNIEITTHRVSYQPRQSAQGSSVRFLHSVFTLPSGPSGPTTLLIPTPTASTARCVRGANARQDRNELVDGRLGREHRAAAHTDRARAAPAVRRRAVLRVARV